MPLTAPKARILVVEDEAIVARDIQYQLRDLGYEVAGYTARGDEAIVLSGQLMPDLVLMDIQLLGDIDGIGAAQAIRVQYGLPVVFLTAFAADDMLARAKLTEPFGYILKPFSERELRTVLEMAIYKHQAETQLRETAQHTQSILDNMVDCVITINSQGEMETFNKAACKTFGYTLDEVLGRNIALLMPESPVEDTHSPAQHIDAHWVVGSPRELEGRRKNGSCFPVSLSVSKITRGGKTTYIGLVSDITERRQHEEEINRLAFYDSLTNLPNRRLLIDRLKHAMLTSGRKGQRGALMFLDLDFFKLLNDSLGHDLGDRLLQEVASRLQNCVREADTVARLGGDEFVVLLEALSPLAHEAALQTEAVAQKIIDALCLTYQLGDVAYSITSSIGIVVFMADQENMEDLLKKADVAMYQAKAAGRNTARFFDPAMQAAAEARASLEQDMRRGLSSSEFILHYQIQVDQQGKTLGAEALVRWRHATHGMVLPFAFIPLAEETGMILQLGQWVLETACAQLVVWASDPAKANWTMAVNMSASQFAQADLVDNVDRALRQTGANPQRLKLELTESMLVADVEDVIVKMTAIKARGITFSLDDFGTGYSSLSYLKRLPLDQLKIDQSFVRDVLSDPNDAVIARTIVALGHSLGFSVIAEGVETAAQFEVLSALGCNAYQGYYFGRPVDAAGL